MVLILPKRTQKPRLFGVTSVNDRGMTLAELKAILEDYHDFVDIAKLGVGTAYILPNLTTKLSLYKEYNIIPYLGGTLFEKFYSQRSLDDYFQYLEHLKIDCIEISNGMDLISLQERLQIVKRAKNYFRVVICEVGLKDTEKALTIPEWLNEMKIFFKLGCDYIVAEGRDSGTAGIYKPSGEIRKNLVKEIVKNFDINKIIFEAPKEKAQMFFINQVGANVNLGNVCPRSLVLLEAQRQGLRYETFNLS